MQPTCGDNILVPITREMMVNKLREGKCRVLFTKINGEERDMECTLEEVYIPDSAKPKNQDDDGLQTMLKVIKAYDVKAQGWRSFRVENVKTFEAL
jgi:hypothetical protein